MIEQLLAINYYQKKEKTLDQRKNIDQIMNGELSELKKDNSLEAKIKIEYLEAEIASTELEFKTTIEELGKVHNDLFPFLEKIKAFKQTPFLVNTKSFHFGIYIDGYKNIHYSTL